MSNVGSGSEPRLSDDRQWWWDGSQWLPASQAPVQVSPPLQTSVPSVTPYGPTAGPVQPASPATSGGVPSWMAVVGLVFCFPVGIVLTLLTRWSVKAKAIAIGVVLALAVVGGVAVASAPKSSPSANVGLTSPAATPSAALASPSPISSPKPQFVTFGSGTLVVGKDIKAGTYRTRHDSQGCYFARLKGFGGTLGDILANDNTDAPAVVTILPADKGFQSSNCDTWTSDLSPITTSKTSFGAGDFIVGRICSLGRTATLRRRDAIGPA